MHSRKQYASHVPRMRSLRKRLKRQINELRGLCPLRILTKLPTLSSRRPRTRHLQSTIKLPSPRPTNVPTRPCQRRRSRTRNTTNTMCTRLRLNRHTIQRHPNTTRYRQPNRQPTSRRRRLRSTTKDIPPRLRRRQRLTKYQLNLRRMRHVSFWHRRESRKDYSSQQHGPSPTSRSDKITHRWKCNHSSIRPTNERRRRRQF